MKKTSMAAFGLSLLAATGLVHAQAQAQDRGGYLLGAFGKSSYNIDCEGFRQCDKSGSMTKVVAGYRMNQGLAIEGVAMNFGKATAADSGVDVDAKITAYGVGAALMFDMTPQFGGVLRLGAASVKATATGRGFGITVSESETKIKPYYGIALAYRFSKAVWFEAGYDGTSGEIEGDSGRVTGLSLGVGLRF